MVLYAASDLVWSTRIRAAAEDAGVPSRPVRDVGMLEARLADSPVRALVVDLEAFEMAMSLLSRLRGPAAEDRERRVRTLAFGPHVATERLEAARGAGADRVLARGAFDRRLGEILVELNA
jgi:hypothetical protein